MHFKHPELLYALFLLLIPILVHLFRLRRFRKEKFTNVKFLRKAVQQTRKSSEIKRWLVLFLRLCALACIVFAFAQPFLPASEVSLKPSETVIYLDNSYSMQAKGSDGVLLKRAVQDLLERLPEWEHLSFFTNDSEYRDLSAADLKQVLQELEYSPTELKGKAISLMAENLYSQRGDYHKYFIAISDFQDKSSVESIVPVPGAENFFVQMQPETLQNTYLDSAYISARTLDAIELSVSVKSETELPMEVPVSLYDGTKLLAKKTVSLEGGEASTHFELPDQAILEGRIEIEDSGLDFDNTLYFSINEAQPVNVVAIGQGEMSFLRKIYRQPQFNFEAFAAHEIDFRKLSSADLIILNEPRNLPPSLGANLQEQLQEKSILIFIPAAGAERQEYNSLLAQLGMPAFGEKVNQEKLVTEISFEHPLFQGVFEEEVRNFQYPKVRSYFRSGRGLSPILQLETGDAFLASQEQVFLFTSALSLQNSNFQNSPLIVPVFYNIGNLALKPIPLYYTLGDTYQISVPVDLQKDEILRIESNEDSFIPLQESFSSKAIIHLEENPVQPGHYQVQRDSLVLKVLSFNIDRKESVLSYLYPENNTVKTASSLPSVFEGIESKSESNVLWKWFVIFAMIFLMTEMLTLKLFK